MTQKKLRKVLLMTCCALALVAVSVGATLAYLTDTEAVTNTFTVGHVDIQLNEAHVDADGQKVDGGERVQRNNYHLIPGQTYDKDPTITVEGGSEDAYVVAEINVSGMKSENNPMLYTEDDVNGFIGFDKIVTGGVFDANFEDKVDVDASTNTATWTATHETYGEITLTQTIVQKGESYTFYIYFNDEFSRITADRKICLFEKLVIPGAWTNEQIAAVGGMEINIKAYAIQKAGFNNVNDAFEAGKASGWSDYDFDNDDTKETDSGEDDDETDVVNP